MGYELTLNCINSHGFNKVYRSKGKTLFLVSIDKIKLDNLRNKRYFFTLFYKTNKPQINKTNYVF